MPIRLLLVTSQRRIRTACRTLLMGDPAVGAVAEASTEAVALLYIQRWKPEVILYDVRQDDTDGRTAVQRLAAAAPRSRVIALTAAEPAGDGATGGNGHLEGIECLRYPDLVRGLPAMVRAAVGGPGPVSGWAEANPAEGRRAGRKKEDFWDPALSEVDE